MKRKFRCGLLAVIALLVAACTIMPAKNQEITGLPGSPSATTTISGRQLPAPMPKFGGEIKMGALDSKTWWAPRIVPPKKAPNILLITIPPLIMYIFFQRQIVAGMTSGAVKG